MDSETRDRMIQQLADLWGAVAWKSYKLQGRGMLGVRVRKQRSELFVLEIGYLSKAECTNAQARQLVASYDPNYEFVVLIGSSDEDAEYRTISLGRALADVAVEMRPAEHDGFLKPLCA